MASIQSDQIVVRLIVLNDSYDGVMLDRSLLIGPNPVVGHPTGLPLPISIEPPSDEASNNSVVLNPWCLYGRQRTFEVTGEMTFHGYLLRRPAQELRPESPVDADALDVAASPLTVGEAM